MNNKELILDVLSILDCHYHNDDSNPFEVIDAIYAMTRSFPKTSYPEDILND